ncbi:adaptor protein MecA [Lentilactobacillus hilgardii]|uniref:Adapter protein MecA n=1 Tax=Lentilactobacillus hilgardii (strain ATCC 8290 / DSM 20176 / CCUG 30140 / JCM 1155 / KCTC 3500 / NBRC 15886 / NCIMB 8040 / NRRL B-1843 / 9) TaxID=1423757 RepID=C0XKH0_LENH9|nr:adaptor protein MecA [Lentilactobacillus hilgardii]EEI19837.1 negative regulator of genetic competence (MecA) [Lentilactobacillus buchneri ATCC 11577]EEI24073.1 negative regulator of genetic competence (MecA) [Lentilactobacillus hilgardii DSM 20176 = ATCC 8290]KRK58021.1 competence negative regulator MecA [Lentilactobacillus hilgardii DSM 20176 = ATCC 8290]MCP9332850.1 adaptor protein MecA [Lentilactobacillus hilgardii]MCP9349459.1 adaptor protein MecA [Lentilactobacillus hilgardii]
MEMERINENTIRVLIGNDDLDKRGITVLDLLGNHKQIESFFYSILEEVDKDHQFQNNDAVTFQVLPNQNGLELFISKDVDMSDEDEPLLGSSDGHEKHDQVSKYIDEHGVDNKPQSDKKTNDEFGHQKRTVILEFDDLNDFIELSKALRLENGTSDLYLYEGKYFLKLQLFSNDPVDMIVSDEVAIANEYGKKTTVTEDVLNEYGQQIMENSALELSRYYFK